MPLVTVKDPKQHDRQRLVQASGIEMPVGAEDVKYTYAALRRCLCDCRGPILCRGCTMILRCVVGSSLFCADSHCSPVHPLPPPPPAQHLVSRHMPRVPVCEHHRLKPAAAHRNLLLASVCWDTS